MFVPIDCRLHPSVTIWAQVNFDLFLPMKEFRKPLKRKGGGFNIYGSEGPEYVDLLRALRDPVEIWSIDVDVQA